MLEREKFNYELIDCGNWRRIERFGKTTINRPCPQATWQMKNSDAQFDTFFDRDQAPAVWKDSKPVPKIWPLKIGHVTAELRFSANGQVGIFPEQFDNWQWMNQKIRQRPNQNFKILNTFAYTGMSTLFTSAPNTEVCHVDGAKSAISWAKRNAELSKMSGNHIRWICDDVIDFMAREVRRGNQYDGIILDPPAFGRGAKKNWKLERDLPELMDLVAKLLTDRPLFVILTCHAPDHFHPEDLAAMLEDLPQFKKKRAETLELKIPSATGHALPSSFGARISR